MSKLIDLVGLSRFLNNLQNWLPVKPGTDRYSCEEGNKTEARGRSSHAEGEFSTAIGAASHAEGYETIARGFGGHAEGYNTTAKASYSHAEGYYTNSKGDSSHAEGIFSSPSGYASHAEGQYTLTYNQSEHAEGQYNVSNMINGVFGNAGNTIHSVGIGTGSGAEKNAFEIMQNGDAYLYGVGGYNGTNAGGTGIKTIQAAFAKEETWNNLVHSGNEITMVPSAFSGDLWFNYRTCGGFDGSISSYRFGNGNQAYAPIYCSGVYLSGAENKIQFGTGHYIELVNIGTAANPTYAFHFSDGIYSNSFVTAHGIAASGGGGGSLDAIYRYANLGGSFSDSANDTFNAYTINSLHVRITNLETTVGGMASRLAVI